MSDETQVEATTAPEPEVEAQEPAAPEPEASAPKPEPEDSAEPDQGVDRYQKLMKSLGDIPDELGFSFMLLILCQPTTIAAS